MGTIVTVTLVADREGPLEDVSTFLMRVFPLTHHTVFIWVLRHDLLKQNGDPMNGILPGGVCLPRI